MLRLRIRALANAPRADDAARMPRLVVAASAMCSLLASVRCQGTCGLQVDGAMRGELTWPIGPALRLQAALVGGVVGTPDASALQERLPQAVVRF